MEQKLEYLETENLIWIIYIFIAIFAIVSNYLEKRYYLFHSYKDKEKYKYINITIFIVALLIYLYFLYLDISNKRKNKYSNIHTLAALLFFIGGAIYLYVECKTFNEEDEVAIT